MLSPLRYLILLLMVLCIGGRSVSWMTLGFMTGMRAGYIALAATIIVMLLDWQSILRAVQDVWYLRASYETFLLLTTLLSIIELLVTKNENTYLPILTIAWCLTGTAGLMHNQATLRSLRAVITGRGRKGIRTAREQWEHTDVIGKAPVTTAGFVRHQAQPDVWHQRHGAVSSVPAADEHCGKRLSQCKDTAELSHGACDDSGCGGTCFPVPLLRTAL